MNESKILKWSVIIGIMIVLNLFFNYTLSLVYGAPEFENFCPQTQVVNVPDNQNECVAEGGQWTSDAFYKPRIAGEVVPAGYCDLQYTCRQAYDDARDTHSRNIFVALVVLGALSVFIGNFFAGNMVISNGLALGGVLSFVIASMRYWGAANDLIRVIILAIALGILFYIAYKKFNDRLRS